MKKKKIKEITSTSNIVGYETPNFVGKADRAKKSTLKNQYEIVKQTYKHTIKR